MPQSQITALNDFGTLTGYTYPTNNGVAVDFQFGFYEKGDVPLENILSSFTLSKE